MTSQLSIVVLSNSVGALVVPGGGSTNTYSAWIEKDLANAGVSSTVVLQARWFDFIQIARRDYQSRVRPFRPDIVILQFGLNESQPWLVPVWLLRHLLANDLAASKTARYYRHFVARPVWKGVRRWRRTMAGPAGLLTWQLTPGRFSSHLTGLIRTLRQELGAAVLVCDINAPGPLLETWLPGQRLRWGRYQDVLAEAVDGLSDPRVRLVRTSRTVDLLGTLAALPDGQHWSAAAHRLAGRMLADEILLLLPLGQSQERS